METSTWAAIIFIGHLSLASEYYSDIGSAALSSFSGKSYLPLQKFPRYPSWSRGFFFH